MSKKNFLTANIIEQSTRRMYETAIKKYETYNNMSFQALLDEALYEQETNVPNHKIKIYDRLLGFRNHIMTTMIGSSVSTYMTVLKTIYKNNRVKVPDLPQLNQKQCLKNPEILFSELLTKEDIQKAMNYLDIRMKARTLAITSGGLSNAEADVLTTRQFLDDLYVYHQETEPIKALKYLANENNCHLWVTKLTRKKTKKPYYAVFNPEAVQTIALAKLDEKTLNPKLLSNNKQAYSNRLALLNDTYEFGYAGGHKRLRPHMLRKFHATNISGSVLNYGEESSLRNFEIDELQGRGKTSVQDTYIKTNPVRLKLLYAKVMNKVSLYHEYEYEFVDGDVLVWVKDHKKDCEKLVHENDVLKKEASRNNRIDGKLKSYIHDVGFDNFKNELEELLNEL